MPRVDLDTLTFNNGVDGSGVDWIVEDLPGWEAAEAALSLVDKVGEDGQIVTQSRLSGRPLVLVGWIVAPSETTMWAARNSLETVIDTLASTGGTLSVYETVTKSLTVYYADRLRLEHRTPLVMRFELPLVAPDPAKV